MKIATKYYYYFGTVVFILFLLFLALRQTGGNLAKDVELFAKQIIDEYRLSSNYSGLMKKKDNLIAGDKNGQQLGFGAKSFYIIADDISASECKKIFLHESQLNLSLISLEVNKKEISPRDLPAKADALSVCNEDKNTIIWNFM